MRFFGEFRGPGVGDPDLEGTQSPITQSNSVFGDSLPHVTVSHGRYVMSNWRWSVPHAGGSTGRAELPGEQPVIDPQRSVSAFSPKVE